MIVVIKSSIAVALTRAASQARVHTASEYAAASSGRIRWNSPDSELVYGSMFKNTNRSRVQRLNVKWASKAPAFVQAVNQSSSPLRDIYQFGVYTGGSMRSIKHQIPIFHHMWGFDSFQGLPAEAGGLKIAGKHWLPGAFSSSDELGSTVEKTVASVSEYVGDPDRVSFIAGFFNESLPKLNLSLFRPALLVDFDVDLYISTLDSMTWMVENKLIQAGTYVRYDDWKGDPAWGQTKADDEVTKRFKIVWDTTNAPFEGRHGKGALRRVVSVGGIAA